MSEWKLGYVKIREAIESDDMVRADELVKEQDAFLRERSFTAEELPAILEEHETVYRMLEQRKNNIKDLLMEQASAQKVAKKYSDD